MARRVEGRGMTELQCDDCGLADECEDPALSGVQWVRDAEQRLCGECAGRFYAHVRELNREIDLPERLEKTDGRYSAHDRRYGARRHDFANLLARAELEAPWRVKPVAVDGHLTVLAATGGDGKTWLGFGMAAGVAYGSAVAGMECAQGRTVIFDAENGPWVLGSRLKTLEDGMPADRVAIYDAEGLRLSDVEDRAWMLATIKAERRTSSSSTRSGRSPPTRRKTAATRWPRS
jgi:hypothetical protein